LPAFQQSFLFNCFGRSGIRSWDTAQ
jgi:hypothetical protein